VKWNIERYINTKGHRAPVISAPVASVDVVDASTVKFNLKSAFAARCLPARRPRGHDGLAEGRRCDGADFT